MQDCPYCSTSMEDYATVCPGCGAIRGETVSKTWFVGWSDIFLLFSAWSIFLYGVYWILNWIFGLPFIFWILSLFILSCWIYKNCYNTSERTNWHR